MTDVRSPLLERGAELDALRALMQAACRGQGEHVVIEAPAGLGKTALLEAALDRAPDGATVLRARANILESEFAFGVVRQAMEGAVRGVAVSQRRALFAGAARHAAPILGLDTPDEPLESSEATFRALHGLYWFVANESERSPVVIGVDDLQWADTSSLQFLDYLLTRLADLPIALIATVRSGDERTADPALATFLEHAGRPMRLGLLSVNAVADIVRASADDVDDACIDVCHRITGGNPFYLEQLLAELRDERIALTSENVGRIERIGPSSVSRVVLARMARLGSPALSVAKAVAVLGGAGTAANVKALVELDGDAVDDASDALVGASILRRGHELSFLHPIMQNAVYDEIGPGERSRLHAIAAKTLQREGASEERVAAHLLVTDPSSDVEVVGTLLRAAGRAAANGAPSAAMAYLRRALDESPPHEMRRLVVGRLTTLEVAAGIDGAPARAHEWLELSDSSLERAQAAMTAATALILQGRENEAFGPILSVRQDLLAEDDRVATAWLDSQIALYGWLTAESAPFGAIAASGLPDSVGVPEVDRLIKLTRSIFAVFRGDSDARILGETLEQCLSGPNVMVEIPLEHPAFAAAMWTTTVCGAYEVVDRFLVSALREVRRRGSSLGTALALHWRALLRLHQGAVADAAEDARLSLELCVANGWPYGVKSALAMLIESMLAWRGVRDANAAVDPTWRVDLARGIPDAQLLVVRASVAVAEGRADDARDDLLAAAELYTALGMTNPACAPWRAPAALVAFRGGDVAEADRLTSEELESEERFGAKRSLGIALRTRGVVRADLDLLEASVRTLEGSGARLELARSLYEYGSALRRTNHRKDSEPRLHEAHDLARTIDARPLVSKIEDELGALGRPVPSRPVTGVDALTGSERRVVALAASGLSNPEIAQMLFVTRKTVEKHLGNAYLKLGISSRADLPQTIPTGESSLA